MPGKMGTSQMHQNGSLGIINWHNCQMNILVSFKTLFLAV